MLELQFFARAFLWGVFLALLYDFIRLFRCLVRHGTLALAVEDILYWLACGILIFRMLYEENSGAIRGFAIAAVILGMLLCLQLEKLLKKVRKKLHNSVKSGIMSFKVYPGRKEVMTTKTRRVMKRKRRMEFKLVFAAVLCLLLVASFGKLRLQQKNEAYQKQEEELLAQISEEQERTQEIEELKKYVQTKKYVEEVAKERLGLVYEDEILFKAEE